MKLVKSFTWSIVPAVQVMLVDNVNAVGIDTSSLPAGTFMVEWREGRGEIETTTAPGLRTIFYDVTPYASMFQKFMTQKVTDGALTLAQSQQIQTNLIECLYDFKRQAPITFTPAGGTSASWPADDSEIAAMSLTTIPYVSQSVSGGSGSLVSQINGVIDSFNSIISALGGQVNTFQANYNANAISVLNNQLPKTIIASGATGSAFVGAPGVSPATPPSVVSFATGSASHISAPAAGGPVPWSPIGATTPINLTMTDVTNLMTNIATRRQTLQNTENSKKNAVNALATIAAVIAYDVTAGW